MLYLRLYQIRPKQHIYQQNAVVPDKPVGEILMKRASSLRRLLNQVLSQRGGKKKRQGRKGVSFLASSPHLLSTLQFKEYKYLIDVSSLVFTPEIIW